MRNLHQFFKKSFFGFFSSFSFVLFSFVFFCFLLFCFLALEHVLQRREIPATVAIESLIFTQGIGNPRVLLITGLRNPEDRVLVLVAIRQIANANGVLDDVEILTRELILKILGLQNALVIRSEKSAHPVQNGSLLEEAD